MLAAIGKLVAAVAAALAAWAAMRTRRTEAAKRLDREVDAATHELASVERQLFQALDDGRVDDSAALERERRAAQAKIAELQERQRKAEQ